jgi:hypothetical protein
LQNNPLTNVPVNLGAGILTERFLATGLIESSTEIVKPPGRPILDGTTSVKMSSSGRTMFSRIT